jgi:pyruvate/2-oxoglutarate/acetoin dehydrogenase E1 component
VSETDFRQAISDAISEEMQRDESVILIGEDIAYAGGVFQATRGLLNKYGPQRVLDTPISELALAGTAFGAAVTGLRPIIEIMFGDFMALAMDSLVNQAAKYWFLSNEQHSVPLVIRSAVGGGAQFGAIHSQIPIPWLLSVPGLKIAAPSNPADARSLLMASIRDDNPVVFLEHKRLYGLKGEASDGAPSQLGKAKIVRPGKAITIVTAMFGVISALEAATELAYEGIEAEVIDLRTIRPLDIDTIQQSVSVTRRLITVEEGPHTGGWSAEILARIGESHTQLESMCRVTGPDLPLPFSRPLEESAIPGPSRIYDAVLAQLERGTFEAKR